ncbi:uncharacterized protein [Henckelia pumila]|uniref:uncharacterized protein n=1 Tax=Henckelia pumila TaxID=405737 RepID=UPI003C6E2E42
MIVALTAKNKLRFIDFTIQFPRSDDLLYGSWIRCNIMVISWLLNSITREIADSLMYMTTASEIWTDLRDRFHQSNAPRVRAQILMLEPLPVITKVFSLVVQEERHRSKHFSVPKIAVDSPSGINSVSLPITIAAATSTKPQSSSFPVAAAAYTRPFERENGGKLDKMMCSYCDFTNHTVDKCFKLHGYPPGHPRYNQNSIPNEA